MDRTRTIQLNGITITEPIPYTETPEKLPDIINCTCKNTPYIDRRTGRCVICGHLNLLHRIRVTRVYEDGYTIIEEVQLD